ncbi:hypothetical protein D3H35_29385 [Cohnella faecalis]|uniref:Uncharacterized protein n=1 Tax=Cohnella faecalis TaxID=2315694 RepID=A0A398CHB1_9BACL|nr:hypothetical protein D3H35_29385 [Cohnella faecalis]
MPDDQLRSVRLAGQRIRPAVQKPYIARAWLLVLPHSDVSPVCTDLVRAARSGELRPRDILGKPLNGAKLVVIEEQVLVPVCISACQIRRLRREQDHRAVKADERRVAVAVRLNASGREANPFGRSAACGLRAGDILLALVRRTARAERPNGLARGGGVQADGDSYAPFVSLDGSMVLLRRRRRI